MRASISRFFPLGLIAWAAWAAIAQAQIQPESLGAQDPRRTPTVEVFHQNKDAVVYLTGPVAGATGPTMDEFFKMPKTREIISIGSGFFVHSAGFIVTNAHASERVISQHAAASDGRTYPAELIGLARNKDLALLRVEGDRPFRAVQLAKSGDFLIGETVIVIGNPAGLIHTCTRGIISAANRSTQSASLPGVTLTGLIQGDAGINVGSSGGPWFNVLGQVVGITTAIKAGAQNIGFAVSVATLREALPDMLDAERLYGIMTGLEIQSRPPCKITSVAAGSPAALVGIRPGDIIARLDERTIADRCDFELGLVGRKPGETLKLQVWRNEKLFTASPVLSIRPKPDGTAMLRDRYGLTAVPLDAEKAHATALRVNRGVVITAIAAGPPYNKLQTPPLPGDVLARINGVRPRDLDHVGMLLDRVKLGEPTHFVLLRMKDRVATRVDMTLTLGVK